MLNRLLIVIFLIFLLSAAVTAETRSDFDLGMDAFNNGKYDLAVEKYKAALDSNPDELGYRYYYALALYYVGKMEDSRSEFQKVIAEGDDSAWAKTALFYVKDIDCGICAPRSEKDLEGSFVFMFENNDNVAYTPFFLEEAWDNRISAQLSGTYKPYLFSYRPVSVTINTYKSNYERNKIYDEYGGTGNISLNLPPIFRTFLTFTVGKGSYYQAYAPYFTSDYFEGALTFNMLPEARTWTTVYIGSSTNLYQNPSYEALGYDSNNANFGVRQNLNALMYVQYDNKRTSTKNDDYDNLSDEYSVGAAIPLPFFFKLFISETLINKGYLNYDSIGLKKRRDTSYVFDFYLSREFWRALTLGTRITVTNNTCNLDKSQTALGYGSYVGHVFSVSMTYIF